MKGLFVIGGILAASLAVHAWAPIHSQIRLVPEMESIWHQGKPPTMFDSQNIPDSLQIINQMEQRLNQDFNQLLEWLGLQTRNLQAGGGFLNTQDVNRQLDQIVQDMNQLDRMMDQAEVHHLKIRRLPSRPQSQQPETSGQQAGRIQITAGDQGVTKSAVQTAVEAVQNISLPILKTNLWEPPQSARIVLFSSRNSYGNSLIRAGVPAGQVQDIVAKTGGLTVGSDIWIPMYNLHSKADLANTLTHELTHVVLNQHGLGDAIPTWVNEGIAWHDGMLAMQQVDPKATQRIENASNQQIQKVADAGQLLPLTVDEQAILTARYNVEWEDYLAVQNLIQQQGIDKFRTFLAGTLQMGVKSSFQTQYRMSLSDYENQFVRSL